MFPENKNKIPKVIHYCWFSDDKKDFLTKDSLTRMCIGSWKEILPDYEIIEWNSTNFDVNITKFSSEAFKKGKWAFVADVFRLWVLYNHGGIYMDTDVEVLKPFDDLLNYSLFTGFENDELLQMAVLGSEKGNIWIKYWLDSYHNMSFINKDNTLNLVPNTKIITDLMKDKGLVIKNENQILDYDFRIFSSDYFSPKDAGTRITNISNNTYTLHHFSGSWISQKMKFIFTISWIFKRIIWNIERKLKIPGLYKNFIKSINFFNKNK